MDWTYVEDGYRAQLLSGQNAGDFETLFGPKGACAGCWCMWYRIPRKEFNAGKGQVNQHKMLALSRSKTTGILLYHNQDAIAWAAIGRRQDFPALENSRYFKQVDGQAVWCLPCFFIHREYRGRGLNTLLIRAAKSFVREQGGGLLEAYPLPDAQRAVAAFSWNGFRSSFEKEGFYIAAERSKDRPVMRFQV